LGSCDVISHVTIRLAVVDFPCVVHCDHASIWHRYYLEQAPASVWFASLMVSMSDKYPYCTMKLVRWADSNVSIAVQWHSSSSQAGWALVKL